MVQTGTVNAAVTDGTTKITSTAAEGKQMLNATRNKSRHAHGDCIRGRERALVMRVLRQAHTTQKVLGERLANALLQGNKTELGRIVRRIAEIVPPAESPAEFLELMSELLNRVGQQAVRLNAIGERFRDLSLTDELTGLHNRRGFYALAAQQLKLARRNGEHALLLFADIDGLKQINDRFGHAEGDIAIKRVAEVLKRTFRESDVLARVGGDEFTILAIEASGEAQNEILSRLREEAARETRYPLSISIGAATFASEDPVTLDALLTLADRAMYETKRARSEIADFATPSESGRGNEASNASFLEPDGSSADRSARRVS